MEVARASNAVEVRNVSKNYPLSDSQLARFRHVISRGKRGHDAGLWALRDVSFEVARGEAFGIIGANGSGKSTLLQIIAGILRPTSGEVEVHGRLSALLELGSGFSPEFTGRDNVYLNGSLLGLSRDEVDARFGEIVQFAEIGDFLDQPVKTYSTGMVLRLAFAVAAHVDPEILIVDEALAVGDIAFRQRCMRRVHDLRARGTTILFVSHETSDVKALCERCIWLQKGVVQEIGEADEVVARYLSMTLHGESVRIEAAVAEHGHASLVASEPEADVVAGFPEQTRGRRYGDGRAHILGADLRTTEGSPTDVLRADEPLVLRFSYRADAPIDLPIVGFLLRNLRGENIFGSNSARENYPLTGLEPGDVNTVEFHFAPPELAAGTYRISIAVSDGTIEDFRVCDYLEDVITVTPARPASGEAIERGYFQLHCASVAVHKS